MGLPINTHKFYKMSIYISIYTKIVYIFVKEPLKWVLLSLK